MSHPSVISYFLEAFQEIRELKKGCELSVLEIGSFDVNGSIRNTISRAINPVRNVGVDLVGGSGIDIVCSGHTLNFPEKSFDCVVSAECLEHNPYWVETLLNMRRMVKNDGYIVISCAAPGRLEHGTTRTNPESSPGTQASGWDYYKNISADEFPKNF